jgi:hypothetical protein
LQNPLPVLHVECNQPRVLFGAVRPGESHRIAHARRSASHLRLSTCAFDRWCPAELACRIQLLARKAVLQRTSRVSEGNIARQFVALDVAKAVLGGGRRLTRPSASDTKTKSATISKMFDAFARLFVAVLHLYGEKRSTLLEAESSRLRRILATCSQ